MIAFRFPLRFANGNIGTVSMADDEFFAQLLASTMQILPGELILRPEFGVQSPEFDAVQTAQFAQLAAQFIPEIQISDVITDRLDNGQVKIAVDFERTI